MDQIQVLDLKGLRISPNTEPDCPHGCENNSGYRVEITAEHPQGLAIPCQCELERRQQVKFEKLLKLSEVGQDRHMTFEKYKPRHLTQEKALDTLSSVHGSYFLFGPWGTGKTHLATASVIRALHEGIQGVRISVPSLLQRMRQFGVSEPLEIEMLAQRIPYLVLDDFGKQKITDWNEERLFELIDKRYSMWRAGKGHTTITANNDFDVLIGRVDGAIIDRISGMCEPFFVDGESGRGR